MRVLSWIAKGWLDVVMVKQCFSFSLPPFLPPSDDSSVANKLHSLRLLQSLVLEPHSAALAHQVMDAIPTSLLQHLASSKDSEVPLTVCGGVTTVPLL